MDDMDLHVSTLFLELQDIYTATYIFKVVDSEWDRKVNERDIPNYSAVRTILYESLVYRVILGLGKIFSKHKEYSLLKATNQIEQTYHSNVEAQEIIKKIRQKLNESRMVKKVRIFRDKFFAHLDKENVLSYFRIDSTVAMQYIDSNEIEEWLSLIRSLYKACFGVELSQKSQMPSKEDIIYTFFWR